MSKTDIINCSSANSGAISLSATGGAGAYQYSINNGGSYQDSPQFTDLQAGAYAIIVKDANGCQTPTSVTVTPACCLTTVASPTTITNGQSATLTASGCSGTVSWVGGPTNSVYVVSPTQTTSYTAICAINGAGTCRSEVTVTFNPLCAISVVAKPATITNGQSSTLTVSGCSGAISWIGTAQEGSVYIVNPTQTTTYTAICTLSASNTCSSSVTVTVNQPVCNLTTSASPTTITNGQSATLTASGCSGNITWTNTEQTGASIVVSPSLTTSYIATCSIPTSGSPVSCTSAVTVTVNQPACNLITLASPTTITSGQSSTLTASGCSGAVYWSGGGVDRGGNSIVVNPTQTTSYTASCVITTSGDPVICTSEVTVTIGQPVCSITTSASPLTITNGQSSTLTASGCAGAVSWVGGPTNSVYIVNPTQTTTYTAICTLSASNTCTSVVTVAVNQPVCALTTSASPLTITNGQSATLTASGCGGTVSWAGGPASSVYVVNPTQTTSYTTTCTIATSGSPVTCQSIVTVTVNQPPCTLTTSASPTTITIGQSSTLTASSCSGTITWTNTEQSGSSIVVSPSNTTTYIATCSIPTSGSPVSCTSAVTVTVNPIPCTLTTSASPLTITNGQSSTLTASGCSGTVSWVGGPTALVYVVHPTQTTSYTATCTIATSGSPVTCQSIVTVTVNQPLCTLTTSASPSTITNGQSATLTATGCSGTVSWAGGPTNSVYVVNPTQTTSYTVTCSIPTSGAPVTCTSVVTVTVNQPACNLTTSASPTTITVGQSSTLTASGCSGTITWTNTEQTGSSIVVSPSNTTTYIATCSIPTSGSPVSCTSAVTVTVNPIPCILTTSASPLTITNGQSATLTASGCSGTVNWVGGPTNSVYVVNPTQTTTYTAICTLSASNTCTSVVTVTVNQPACNLTTSASPTTITNGQSASLTASGCSGTISWTNSEQTGASIIVSPSATTTYTATCTIPTSGSPVSCTSAVTVTVNPIPCTLTTSASPSTITNGQSSTLTASGCSGTVNWVGGPTNSVYVVNPTQTTTYTAVCTLSESNTCTSQVTVTVNQPLCTLTTSASPFTITNGQSSTLTASGCSGTVSWVGGPANSIYVVSPTQTTSYTAICSIPTSGSPVTCTSVVTVTVNQPTCSLTAQANPTTIFNGQSTTLTASGCANGTISWNNSQQIGSTLVVSPSETTVYTASCTIPTSGNPVVCTAPVTVTVINRPACNLQVQTNTPTIFAGSTASLTATGCSGTVSWNTGQSGTSIPVSPAATTSYTATCTISTAAGSVTCLASATVTVIARPVCNLSVQANPTAIFNGQSTTLTASGCTGGTVTWSSQQNGSSIVVSPTLTTTYSATCLISTEAGSVSCTSPVSVSVTQPILQLAGSSDILPLNAVTWIGTVTQNIGSFVWQYKTATGDWVNFPSTFDNSTPITVSATSFLGNEAPAYLNQAIQFRALSPIMISNVLTVTIRQTPPTISSLTTLKAVCSGSSTGSFSLILSRGLEAGESAFQARVYTLAGGVETLVTSYTFTGSTFTSPSVFAKGSYRVRVQSIVGAQPSDETVQDFTIDDNPPITLSATKSDVLCFGNTNGTITLVANGGVGPYQFAINGGAFQNFQSGAQHQINNLSSGTYSIQLRDGNACLSAQPILVTIAQPAASLTITSGVVKNPSGFQLTDGTITLNVTGGTPDYSFAWSVSNPTTSTQPANSG
ncbi:hypothetical protein GO730_01435 [Spirosoma sp. HMF3257]|uniref:beta strand repeat-containing protein n=1 Tax=Spirosoma telluris TaxID=2183553 RepID=UPI0011B93E48|nr:hypothetical protein [Spirosoma telluris]